MSQPPPQPAIYHITHLHNLPAIINRGGLFADAFSTVDTRPIAPIGMNKIKQRRLNLPVHCHPSTTVGQYVPFYFCPRSIMLYLIHKANHEELPYRGGQELIVHLEADLHKVIAVLDGQQQKWAFSLSNAGATYAEFRASLSQLQEINWTAVQATDFRPPLIKEGKQAEFLVYEFFPWTWIRRIGVYSETVRALLLPALATTPHHPIVEVRREWYY
jgi:hypothetical protein